MVVKRSYNVSEFAVEVKLPVWKVLEMLRRDMIKHLHLNTTHAGCRIPREELLRLRGEEE